MGLEQYIINFVTFVNNIGIPFLLGIAFLFFVTNAVRFFVVGGANMESKEKARSLAIYGVFAFVLIMTFWGITVLLTSSLGLNQYATSDNTCFDYDPLCNDGINYDSSGPGSRPSLIGRAGDPTSQGPTGRPITPIGDYFGSSGPGTRPVITNNTDVMNFGGPGTRPAIFGSNAVPQDPGPIRRSKIPLAPGRVAEGIEDFARTFNPTEYGGRFNSVIENSVDVLADPTASTEDRAKAAVLLEINGYIEESELASYIGTLNTERSAAGLQPLDMVSISSEAKEPPETLITEIQQTQRSLLATLAEGSRRWYDIWGAPDRNAQADALALVQQIYDVPADPDRIATFDILLSENEEMNQDELAIARSRMIEEMNAERFYAGFGPLADNSNTESPNIGSGSNQQVQTNTMYAEVAKPAESSVRNVIPDVQNNFLTTQIQSVGDDSSASPVERLEKAKAFEEAGFITSSEYQAVADSLNNALVANGQQPISEDTAASIAPEDWYVDAIVNYKNDVNTATQIISNFYGGEEAAAEQVNKIFNSETYTPEERRQAADVVYREISAQTESSGQTEQTVSSGSGNDLAALEGSLYSALGTEAELGGGQP